MSIEWSKKSIILPSEKKRSEMFGGKLDESNTELMQWMKENGINFDEGEVRKVRDKEVHVVKVRMSFSGKEVFMVTDKNDFGIII